MCLTWCLIYTAQVLGHLSKCVSSLSLVLYMHHLLLPRLLLRPALRLALRFLACALERGTLTGARDLSLNVWIQAFTIVSTSALRM